MDTPLRSSTGGTTHADRETCELSISVDALVRRAPSSSHRAFSCCARFPRVVHHHRSRYARGNRELCFGHQRFRRSRRQCANARRSGDTQFCPSSRNVDGPLPLLWPTDINNNGRIAGSATGSDGISYPAIHDAGSGIAILGSLGIPTWYGFSGEATSINNRGQVVGYSFIDGLTRHAFLYSDGVMTDLGSTGGYSAALRINDAGQAVGFTSDTWNGVANAVLYSDGAMTIINPFDGPRNESYARGINNAGQVVGEALTNAFTFNAFMYAGGASRNLGTLRGGRNSVAFAINDSGLAVGIADYPYRALCQDPYTYQYFRCIKYAQHGFLYENGVMKDLNSMISADDWDLEWAVDINNRGQITGYGRLNGVFRAYVLSPCEARGNGRGKGKGQGSGGCRASAHSE